MIDAQFGLGERKGGFLRKASTGYWVLGRLARRSTNAALPSSLVTNDLVTIGPPAYFREFRRIGALGNDIQDLPAVF